MLNLGFAVVDDQGVLVGNLSAGDLKASAAIYDDSYIEC
jgi:hypothetical protein